jgi:hypothetical protein
MTDLTVSHLPFGETDGSTTCIKFGVWPASAKVLPRGHRRSDDRISWRPCSNAEAVNDEQDERTICRQVHCADPRAAAMSSRLSLDSDAPPTNRPSNRDAPVPAKKGAAWDARTLPPYKI